MVGLQSGVCACKFSSAVWMGVVNPAMGQGCGCLVASDGAVAAQMLLSRYLTARVDR